MRWAAPRGQPKLNKMERKTAKYSQLADWIREKIYSMEFKQGEKLYSENELCSMFGVSRQTVRHAIASLEEEGLLRSVRGSGTFIGNYQKDTRPKTRNVAIITTYMDSYIFPNTLQGTIQTLSEAGYKTQIEFTNNSIEKERRILEQILQEDIVDGVIVEAAKSALPNPNLPYYQELLRRQIKLLFFNCKYAGLDVPMVALDDRKAASEAVNYLIEKGHQQIAGIFKMDDGQGMLRYAGYMDALMGAGIRMDDKKVLWIDTQDQRNLKSIKGSILRRLAGCTAVLCYNDEVAYELLKILKQEDIRVPEQFSVVSIDASKLSTLSEPQITSVLHPSHRLGEKVAENMLGLIRIPDYDANYLVRPELIIRESVKEIGVKTNE